MSKLAYVAFLIISTSGYSQNICTNIKYVIYANGMNNSKKDADSIKNKISNILGVDNNLNVKYDKAYNYDDLLPIELLEAYQQKQGEKMELFWKWFFDWSSSPDWFKKIIYKYMDLYNRNILAYSNTQEQVIFYKSILDQKGKILTIAHSQGNLFSNEAYTELEKEYKLKGEAVLASVATLASYVYGNGDYFTLKSDGVINAVRIASKLFNFNEPLPANAENINPKAGMFDHEFIPYYLYSTPTGNKLISSIKKTINEFTKEENKKIEEEIGTTCVDWWRELEINKKEPEACVLECTSARVGMSTFMCTTHCKYFCKCML